MTSANQGLLPVQVSLLTFCTYPIMNLDRQPIYGSGYLLPTEDTLWAMCKRSRVKLVCLPLSEKFALKVVIFSIYENIKEIFARL